MEFLRKLIRKAMEFLRKTNKKRNYIKNLMKTRKVKAREQNINKQKRAIWTNKGKQIKETNKGHQQGKTNKGNK